MKKLAVVLGVAAVATLSGCKDPDYVSKRRPAPPTDEVTVIPGEEKPATPAPAVETPPAPAPVVVAPAPAPVTPQPAPVAQPPVEPEYTIYIVQPGDYLSKISAKYSISMSSIRKLNPSMKKDIVRVGMKLKLPGKIDVGVQSAVTAPAAKPAKNFKAYEGATKEYVVKSGDTLGGIAYSNGMTIRQLKQLNGLTKDSLNIGQKLKIAADGKPVAKKSKTDKKPAKEAKTPAETKPAETNPAADAAVPATDAATPAADAAPAVEAAPAVPAAPATSDYIVQEGEDITGIALSCQTTPAVIRELNGFDSDVQVKAGQTIKIPAEGQR